MYKVPNQNEPTHIQMMTLYQRMMQWALASKKAYDTGNLEEYHRILERMSDLQTQIFMLFEPPAHATNDQKKACQTMQAAARKVLIALVEYVANPRDKYNKLCLILVQIHEGWKQVGQAQKL